MANRDYKKEYQQSKDKAKLIGLKVDADFFDAFTAKAELNGTNKNAILKACAEAYTYGNLIIDENGKPKIVDQPYNPRNETSCKIMQGVIFMP